MRRSPRHLRSLGLACALAAGCAGSDNVIERNYPTNEFVARGAFARVELVHAAYLPRGVEFEVLLTNESQMEVTIERDGLLLAYHGLEYPLDVGPADDAAREQPAVAEGEIPVRVRLGPEDQRMLALRFRLGRPMTESGWVVVRGLRVGDELRDPIWLEVPAAPSKVRIEPKTK